MIHPPITKSLTSSFLTTSLFSITVALVLNSTEITAGICPGFGGGNYNCSGAASGAGLDLDVFIAEPLSTTVTTDPGFGLDNTNFSTSPALSVTSAGNISIDVSNATAITGGDFGIFATTITPGTMTTISTGSATITSTTFAPGPGLNYSAIGVQNNGTDVNIAAGTGTITGGRYGINVRSNGTGSVNVTSAGDISGLQLGSAISVINFSGTDATINNISGTLTGASNGIFARNNGSGIISIINSGDVIATNFHGIVAVNTAAGDTISINSGTGSSVTGGTYGIRVLNNVVAGLTTITAAGNVTGGTNYGIRIQNGLGSMTNITLNSGANVSSTSGLGILDSLGDSNIVVNTGAAIAGEIHLDQGSDNLTFAGGDFSAVTIFDGGDDINTADGFIDTLTFNNASGAVDGNTILNWENVIIDTGTLVFSNGALTVGSDAGTGLTLQNGGTLDAAGGFTLTGNMHNGGIISSQDNNVGDVISVSGNYIGNGGQLSIDTVLDGDASATDLFTIAGDTSGNTTVNVQNVGGGGAQTVNGIEVIQVTGVSAGNFILNGDFVTSSNQQAVIGGAFGYTLEQQADGGWALLSQLRRNGIVSPLYQPATPVYEAIPQNLLTLTDLPTLQQRVGNRNWAAASSINNQDFSQLHGAWSRINIASRNVDSDKSTTYLDSKTRYSEIQVGFDMPVRSTENSEVIIGVNGSYGHAKSDVDSVFGDGDIRSNSYNVGATATWYSREGGYVDGQFKYGFINTELHSDILSGMKSLDANGISASVEAGKQINVSLKHKLSITPQAQLIYSTVDFDSFNGRYGGKVSMEDSDRLKGRLGITLDHQLARSSDSEPRRHLYAIANIIHEFDKTTSVKVSGTKLKNKIDQDFAEIGVGGTYNWNKDKYSIYGEIRGETSLENIGNSQSFSATAGFRMKL